MRRLYSGHAFAAICSVALFVCPTPSFAQQLDASNLAACLVENTTNEHIAAMKRLMIAALSDNTEMLKVEAMNYGEAIVQLVTTNCNIGESQLADPAVNEAVGIYGQKLGEKVITEAFAKIQ